MYPKLNTSCNTLVATLHRCCRPHRSFQSLFLSQRSRVVDGRTPPTGLLRWETGSSWRWYWTCPPSTPKSCPWKRQNWHRRVLPLVCRCRQSRQKSSKKKQDTWTRQLFFSTVHDSRNVCQFILVTLWTRRRQTFFTLTYTRSTTTEQTGGMYRRPGPHSPPHVSTSIRLVGETRLPSCTQYFELFCLCLSLIDKATK